MGPLQKESPCLDQSRLMGAKTMPRTSHCCCETLGNIACQIARMSTAQPGEPARLRENSKVIENTLAYGNAPYLGSRVTPPSFQSAPHDSKANLEKFSRPTSITRRGSSPYLYAGACRRLSLDNPAECSRQGIPRQIPIHAASPYLLLQTFLQGKPSLDGAAFL